MPSKSRLDLLTISSTLYLVIPFIIFTLAYIQIWISIPGLFLLSYVLYRIFRSCSKEEDYFSKKSLLPTVIIVLIWVLLSGIGGYAFQNPDFHLRNAIFNDLINYKWPVVYTKHTSTGATSQFLLTYYIGFWLPSALIGKLFGWQAGNIALFAYSFAGVILAVFLLHRVLKSGLLFSSLLLIFFSGMDFLANALLQRSDSSNYPYLWPPISHLEWTIPHLQYSSFSTQLFWVFNQAIPCWIVVLLLQRKHVKASLFLWGLCFFYSPLPALGLIPIILFQIFSSENLRPYLIDNDHKTRTWFQGIKKSLKSFSSIENILGGTMITLVSLAYFSTNNQSLKFGLIKFSWQNAVNIFFFVIFEYLTIWLILGVAHKKDVLWYIVGVLLFLIPWMVINDGTDFCMRVSIAPLMILMIWTGQFLVSKKTPVLALAISLILAIGAITPIFEINRSIFRTAQYWLHMTQGFIIPAQFPDPKIPNSRTILPIPETDHPDSLWAMNYPSLDLLDPDEFQVYLSDNETSFFVRQIMRK